MLKEVNLELHSVDRGLPALPHRRSDGRGLPAEEGWRCGTAKKLLLYGLERREWFSYLNTCKTHKLISASSKSEHFKNEKKNILTASHFHQCLKFKQIINQYLLIYPVENTSNISKQSGDYIQTSYAKGKKMEYSNFVTI